jgi:hypothetical protein
MVAGCCHLESSGCLAAGAAIQRPPITEPAMPENGNDKVSRLVPVLVLAGVVLLCVVGWWLFPRIQGVVTYQDCVASGRTNC